MKSLVMLQNRPSTPWLCVRQVEVSQEMSFLQLSLTLHCWEVEGIAERRSLLPHPDLLAEVIEGAENEV